MASSLLHVIRKMNRSYVKGAEIMGNELKVGDTICCNDYADMNDVLTELRKRGYLTKVQVGYTIRIESVPAQDPTEQDGWVTWNK